MRYFEIALVIVALLGVVVLLSGCVKSDDKDKLLNSQKDLEKSVSGLDKEQAYAIDDIDTDLQMLDDNTISDSGTELEKDLGELNDSEDVADDLLTDLEELDTN